MSWFTGVWEGLDLSGDFLNVRYATACKVGLFDYTPDCGHPSCGLLCDVLLVQVRRRRKAAAKLQGATVGRQGR